MTRWFPRATAIFRSPIPRGAVHRRSGRRWAEARPGPVSGRARSGSMAMRRQRAVPTPSGRPPPAGPCCAGRTERRACRRRSPRRFPCHAPPSPSSRPRDSRAGCSENRPRWRRCSLRCRARSCRCVTDIDDEGLAPLHQVGRLRRGDPRNRGVGGSKHVLDRRRHGNLRGKAMPSLRHRYAVRLKSAIGGADRQFGGATTPFAGCGRALAFFLGAVGKVNLSFAKASQPRPVLSRRPCGLEDP